MKIKKEIKGKTYVKLMQYIWTECDIVSLRKRYDQHSDINSRILNIILKNERYSVQDIVNNYSDEFLNIINNKFLYDKDIFNDDFCTMYGNDLEDIDKQYRKIALSNCIGYAYYNEVVRQWLNKYKRNIIYQKECIYDDIIPNKKIHQDTTYFLKLTEPLKKEILDINAIYTWCFPLMLEDISFYKDGYCWLDSVAHEELCFIYCKNEEEYEYLKSIGIEFVEDKFVPTSKDELYYVDYKSKD